MFLPTDYKLLDFGAGRKLERFGSMILDRPAQAAENSPQAAPTLWNDANARFELDPTAKANLRGKWFAERESPTPWTIQHESIHFELKLTDFGHIGVFPEQASNWDWLAHQIQLSTTTYGLPQASQKFLLLRLLNLFAYTGGSTLAAAAAGAAVTHVDAAKNIVSWARRNAELSGLSGAPIRWISDDARKFVGREIKRGQSYDGVILDPPSYGHGSRGEAWKLDEHLPELLSMCRELTGPKPRLILLTCHAKQFVSQRLADCLCAAGFAFHPQEIEADDAWLTTDDGRRLHCGTFARICR